MRVNQHETDISSQDKFFLYVDSCNIYGYVKPLPYNTNCSTKRSFRLLFVYLNDVISIIAAVGNDRFSHFNHDHRLSKMGIENTTLFLLRLFFAEEVFGGQWHLYIRPSISLPVHLLLWGCVCLPVCLSVYFVAFVFPSLPEVRLKMILL